MLQRYDRNLYPFFQQAVVPIMPPINIKEEGHRYVVEVELPGLDIDDLDIQVYGNSITIRAERKNEEERKGDHFHIVERRYGSFHRSFTLPEHIHPQEVEAEHRNGILYISVPKHETNSAQKIKIKKQE
jgi:HSP20 family protein